MGNGVSVMCQRLSSCISVSLVRQREELAAEPNREDGADVDDAASSTDAAEAQGREHALRTACADLVCAVMGLHRQLFMEYGVPHFLELLHAGLGESSDLCGRYSCLYLSRAVLENASDADSLGWSSLFGYMLGTLSHADEDVRRLAAHCVCCAAGLGAFQANAALVSESLRAALTQSAVAKDGNTDVLQSALAAVLAPCEY